MPPLSSLVVCVTGGRNYKDREHVNAILNQLRPGVVIQGGARGADALALDWALASGAEVETYRANWEKYGAHAGPKRNLAMLQAGKPGLVIAFPGGKGTLNCVQTAAKLGIPVLLAEPRKPFWT